MAGAIDMITPEQKAELLVAWNDPNKRLKYLNEVRTTMRKNGVTPDEERILTDNMLGKEISIVQLETGLELTDIHKLYDSGIAKLQKFKALAPTIV